MTHRIAFLAIMVLFTLSLATASYLVATVRAEEEPTIAVRQYGATCVWIVTYHGSLAVSTSTTAGACR